MARLEVRYSSSALDDLDLLYDYVVKKSGFYRTDESFTGRIATQCERLADYPELGRSRDDLVPDLRTLPFESVMIIYSIHANHISIIRIFDGRRDYQSILRDR